MDPSDVYTVGNPIWVGETLSLYGPAVTATTDVNAIEVGGVAGLQLTFNLPGPAMAARRAREG